MTGGVVAVHGNEVGVIVDNDHAEVVLQALKSLIGGAKHASVFGYLERMNAEVRMKHDEDLGLR